MLLPEIWESVGVGSLQVSAISCGPLPDQFQRSKLDPIRYKADSNRVVLHSVDQPDLLANYGIYLE